MGADILSVYVPFNSLLLQLKRVKEKVVSVVVNGHVVPGVHMKVCRHLLIYSIRVSFSRSLSLLQLGAAGEAFFVEEADEPVTTDYTTSPLGSPVQLRTASSADFGSLPSGPKHASVHFDLPSDVRVSVHAVVHFHSRSKRVGVASLSPLGSTLLGLISYRCLVLQAPIRRAQAGPLWVKTLATRRNGTTPTGTTSLSLSLSLSDTNR